VNFSTQTQSIAILQALLEHPGELVTREALRDRLWGPDTFVDYEAGLNAAVRRLREALNDSADTPRYVETLPRRGYRFIAPVDVASTSPQASPSGTAAADADPIVSPDGRHLYYAKPVPVEGISKSRSRAARDSGHRPGPIAGVRRRRQWNLHHGCLCEAAGDGPDVQLRHPETRHGSAAPAGLRIPAGPYLNVTCDGRSMLYVRYDQWTSDIEMVRGIR
jgi:DNA-binding winged helix-turn-helix (wHTH) protein